MTTTVAGFILLVLGVLICVVGIIYQPPSRRRDIDVLNDKWYDKVVDAIIGWIDGLIGGRSPKKQLITLGVLIMIAGTAIIIWPAITRDGTPSPTPSVTSSPTGEGGASTGTPSVTPSPTG